MFPRLTKSLSNWYAFECLILLTPPPQCWDHRCAPPSMVSKMLVCREWRGRDQEKSPQRKYLTFKSFQGISGSSTLCDLVQRAWRIGPICFIVQTIKTIALFLRELAAVGLGLISLGWGIWPLRVNSVLKGQVLWPNALINRLPTAPSKPWTC